jgi:multidrug efflux pump subunit AcrB
LTVLGEILRQLGFAVAICGYFVWLASIVFRLAKVLLTRRLDFRTVLVGFYARAAGTLGLMVMVIGLILKGTVPWPWVILVFVVGGPSLALLLVRPVRDESFTGEIADPR